MEAKFHAEVENTRERSSTETVDNPKRLYMTTLELDSIINYLYIEWLTSALICNVIVLDNISRDPCSVFLSGMPKNV